jgi:hypothetical protein
VATRRAAVDARDQLPVQLHELLALLTVEVVSPPRGDVHVCRAGLL